MSATPDGWVITGDMEYLLECKTAFSYAKHEWVDDSYGEARNRLYRSNTGYKCSTRWR